MSKRGMPEVASGDVKAPSPLSSGHKQTGHEMLPSRHARAQLTGGDAVQRTMGNYAKQSPADVSGAATPGLNLIRLANG